MSATPPWKIAVLTSARAGEGEYRELKNALLYGDHTHWIDMKGVLNTYTVGFYQEVYEANAYAAQKHAARKHQSETVVPSVFATYVGFRKSLKSGGAEQFITVHFDSPEAIRQELRPHWDTDLFIDNIRKSIAGMVRECRVFVSTLDGFDPPVQNWNTYNAAHALMMGMSRLLLPDVSDLPIEGIMDLREKMKDSLDPMRAEMLGLTEDLRKIVGDSRDPDLLTAEVNNLIATRVERVVRNADRRASELLQKKWRKLLAGAAKAFGFAGAGFLNPKLLAKAVHQTLETGALALSPVEDHGVAMSETAQFVLRARRLAVQRHKG
jgi:hypothetical protein